MNIADDIETVRTTLPNNKEAVLALSRIAGALAQRERLVLACSSTLEWVANMRVVPGGARARIRDRLAAALKP